MRDETSTPGWPAEVGKQPRNTALQGEVGQEAAAILSATRWMRFDLARLGAMWNEDRLQGPDPLAEHEAARPTFEDFLEAARRLHETAADLIHHVNRAALARE